MFILTSGVNGSLRSLRDFDLVFKKGSNPSSATPRISTILAEVGSEVEIFLTKPTRSWKKGNVIRAAPGSECVSAT